MNKTISVGIIEDNREFADFLMAIINSDSNFKCDAIYYTAEDAISQIPETNLNVVLTDIGLPGASGIECIAYLKPLKPNLNFLVCTNFEDSDTVFEALKAGATGYLTKGDSPENILEAIQQVHQGGSPMTHHIARLVVQHFQGRQTSSEIKKLSNREQEILDLLAEGYRYKEIADSLFISAETVRTHIRNTYQKLQVSSRMEAINKIYGIRSRF